MQSFKSMFQLREAFPRVCFPRPHPWRLLGEDEAVAGEINGIYRIRGQALATNGIIVAILAGDGTLQFGHWDWFEPDWKEVDLNVVKTRKFKSKKDEEHYKKVMEEYA
jgi:hypothetical protein